MPVVKVIPANEASDLASWEVPDIDGDSPIHNKVVSEEVSIEHARSHVQLPTADEIAAMQKGAHDEAYAKGYQEGLEKGKSDGLAQGHAEGLQQGLAEGKAQGQQQINEQVDFFQQVLEKLEKPLEEMDFEVEQQISSLAMMVAKHLVRRELRTDPGQVIAAVRQAVSVLPVGARDIRVYLHPADATLVREAMSLDHSGEEEKRWRVVEDAALTRGGCHVETESSRIDATIETRLASIVVQALGGERDSDF